MNMKKYFDNKLNCFLFHHFVTSDSGQRFAETWFNNLRATVDKSFACENEKD